MCLQVQNSKDATDKMITHLGKFKKDLEKLKKLALQGEVYPVADAPDLVFNRSGDKGRADVVENGSADTGSSSGGGLDRATPTDSNDSMTSVTSTPPYCGVSSPEPFSYVHLSKLFAKASERHLHVCSVFGT